MLHGRRRRLLTKLQHTRMERDWNATTWLSRGIRPNGSGAFLHCHSHSYIRSSGPGQNRKHLCRPVQVSWLNIGHLITLRIFSRVLCQSAVHCTAWLNLVEFFKHHVHNFSRDAARFVILVPRPDEQSTVDFRHQAVGEFAMMQDTSIVALLFSR